MPMNLSGLSERFPSLPYILPFALFLGLTALTSYVPSGEVWLYPLKTLITGYFLWRFRSVYSEFQAKSPVGIFQRVVLASAVGLLVFVLWILPEGRYPLLGESASWNPYEHLPAPGAFLWVGFRLLGAVVVVPIMEELFWRSFLLRYLINPDFKAIPLGHFTWFSFIATVLLFGVEHHRWLSGILAGICYNLLLYRTKSLPACILAHALTNLVLGIYVLTTQQWGYW